MTTPTLNMSPKADLVDAYEALRQAAVCSGPSATMPADGQRLVRQGLLAWGRQYSAREAQAAAANPPRGVAPQGLHRRAEQPRAAVVSLMATMALQSIDSLEAIS